MKLTSASGPLAELTADLIVVSSFNKIELLGAAKELNAEADDLLEDARLGGAYSGVAFECEWIYPSPVRAKRILMIGAGRRDEYDVRKLRQVSGAAVRRARDKGAKRVCLALELPDGVAPEKAAEVIADGAVAGLFEPGLYKDTSDRNQVEEVLVWFGGTDVSGALARGEKIGQAVNFGRWLAEEPANIMTPLRVADEASKMASENGLECEVLDEGAIKAAGMNSLSSVAEGSQWPPRVVVLSLKNGGDSPTLGLVGKGVTFDTGGISIKPAQDMHLMKYDMCGAAAVISAMLGLAELGAKVNVVAVAGLVENMPGGRATRPGDVVRAANGKTIEILNTDAEGRLVLADALDLARKRGAERLVDVATLTGSIGIALGSAVAGIMGVPQEWVQTVVDSATEAGERLWQLPLYPEYKDQLKSNIADMANVGGRPAGALTAATFLREFVDDTPWSHLDIAATAWTEKDSQWQTRGSTGVMIRTLIGLAESLTA